MTIDDIITKHPWMTRSMAEHITEEEKAVMLKYSNDNPRMQIKRLHNDAYITNMIELMSKLTATERQLVSTGINKATVRNLEQYSQVQAKDGLKALIAESEMHYLMTHPTEPHSTHRPV